MIRRKVFVWTLSLSGREALLDLLEYYPQAARFVSQTSYVRNDVSFVLEALDRNWTVLKYMVAYQWEIFDDFNRFYDIDISEEDHSSTTTRAPAPPGSYYTIF